MITNRQNGRRRGRGGSGPRPSNQSPTQGNRQDNRNRGNAAQLLEKYKSLARDAQMQGDRVQAEYYLQFAEHYFRVLNESRARFEEQRPRRDDYYGDEDDGEDGNDMSADGDDGDDQMSDEREERQPPRRRERAERQDRPERQERAERQDRPERQERPERQDRPERAERQDRPERAERPERSERAERPERVEAGEGERAERAERPRREQRDDRNGEQPRFERPRARRAERTEQSADAANEGTISLDVLPPAISPTISVVEGDAPAKPRRRTRRPRTDDDAEIAPAA